MEDPRARSSSADRERPRRSALDFALARLGRRSHSRGELEDKLARAGYDEGEIGKALAYLEERRYLDDAAFARDFARARSERKFWGPARIERRLRELKLAEAEIEAALADVFPDGEEGPVRAALARLFRLKGEGGGQKGRARAYRHLLARGFSPEVIHRLVSRHDFGDTDPRE